MTWMMLGRNWEFMVRFFFFVDPLYLGTHLPIIPSKVGEKKD